MLKKVKNFFEEIQAEIRKVTWPKTSDVIRITSIIVLIVVTFSVFIGIIDFLFSGFLLFIQNKI